MSVKSANKILPSDIEDWSFNKGSMDLWHVSKMTQLFLDGGDGFSSAPPVFVHTSHGGEPVITWECHPYGTFASGLSRQKSKRVQDLYYSAWRACQEEVVHHDPMYLLHRFFFIIIPGNPTVAGRRPTKWGTGKSNADAEWSIKKLFFKQFSLHLF